MTHAVRHPAGIEEQREVQLSIGRHKLCDVFECSSFDVNGLAARDHVLIGQKMSFVAHLERSTVRLSEGGKRKTKENRGDKRCRNGKRVSPVHAVERTKEVLAKTRHLPASLQ